jgi:hypothetical protein
MADKDEKETKSVLLTGIDELSPKLKSLRTKVEGFRQNLEQAGLGKLDISGLFKGGSVITPFVEAIKASDAFKGKLTEVSESAEGIELPKAPASATQTLNVFSRSMEQVSVAANSALQPAVATVTAGLQPLLNGFGNLLADNPKLVEGLAAGAIAFSAMQTAVTGATQVFDLMNMVLKTNPVMLIATGIALAAGLIIANWKPISAFFAGLWQKISPVVMPMVEFFKTMFAFTPIGQIISHWGPITRVFAAIWDVIKATVSILFVAFERAFRWSPIGLVISHWTPISEVLVAVFGRIKEVVASGFAFVEACFAWTPQGMILNNWGPITGMFVAIWDLLVALVVPVKEVLRGVFDYLPLEAIAEIWGKVPEFFSGVVENIRNVMLILSAIFSSQFGWSPLDEFTRQWDPLTKGISEWVDKVQAIMAPVKEMLGGSFGGFITKVTGKIESLTEAQNKTNAEGKGELAPAFFGADSKTPSSDLSVPDNQSRQPSIQSGSLTQHSSALIQQSAANNRTQLEGGLTVRFENAPAGLRTDQPQTNQPALAFNSRIGYRTLSLGGSNELA